MCGRFTLHAPADQVVTQFHAALNEQLELPLRYNIAPTDPVATIFERDGDRQLRMMRWGLVPFWAKDLQIGNRLINARGETVADKPAFRRAFRSQRCLIPTNGYFEWKKVGKQKQPYYIRVDSQQPFAMAGLWEKWRPTDQRETGQTVYSCTIITTNSNPLTSSVHDRMPVILEPEQYDDWLDDTEDNREQVRDFIRPFASESMRMNAVSMHVNSVRNDDARCIEEEFTQGELF